MFETKHSSFQISDVLGQKSKSKQCRPRSKAKDCNIWSGFTLFASHPACIVDFYKTVYQIYPKNSDT